MSNFWHYLWRAARLRCPVCGQSPLFRPIREVTGLTGWFETLPGCPHCNYAYDRESGYFMMALWSLDYAPAAVVGIGSLLFFTNFYALSTWQLLLATLLPTLIVALLIVRHAKAFYLAIDQYFFFNED